MCNIQQRFFLEHHAWRESCVNRKCYRIRDRAAYDFRGNPRIIATGMLFDDILQIVEVLNAEDTRRARVCCCACHRP